MKIHIKKCVSPHFEAVDDSSKLFEIRKDDCGYQTGDLLIQRHWDEEKKKYNNRFIYSEIGYLTDFCQKEGYVVFSLLNPSIENLEIMREAVKNIEDKDISPQEEYRKEVINKVESWPAWKRNGIDSTHFPVKDK